MVASVDEELGVPQAQGAPGPLPKISAPPPLCHALTMYVTTLNPSSAQTYPLRIKVESQNFTDTVRVYYTVNGSAPGGTFGSANRSGGAAAARASTASSPRARAERRRWFRGFSQGVRVVRINLFSPDNMMGNGDDTPRIVKACRRARHGSRLQRESNQRWHGLGSFPTNHPVHVR